MVHISHQNWNIVKCQRNNTDNILNFMFEKRSIHCNDINCLFKIASAERKCKFVTLYVCKTEITHISHKSKETNITLY